MYRPNVCIKRYQPSLTAIVISAFRMAFTDPYLCVIFCPDYVFIDIVMNSCQTLTKILLVSLEQNKSNKIA